MSVSQLTVYNFDETVATGTSLIFFLSDWYPPCRDYTALAESLAARYRTELSVYTVDTDAYPELAGRLSIMSLPAAVLFIDGREVSRLSGVHTMDTYSAMVENPPAAVVLC